MSTILPSLPGMATSPTQTDRQKLSAVAKQFEAIFMRQMLSAARKTDFGGDQLFGSQALGTFNQMQDEHFADVTAQTGALGFASIIEAQMARFLPSDASTTSAADTSATAGQAATAKGA